MEYTDRVGWGMGEVQFQGVLPLERRPSFDWGESLFFLSLNDEFLELHQFIYNIINIYIYILKTLPVPCTQPTSLYLSPVLTIVLRSSVLNRRMARAGFCLCDDSSRVAEQPLNTAENGSGGVPFLRGPCWFERRHWLHAAGQFARQIDLDSCRLVIHNPRI